MIRIITLATAILTALPASAQYIDVDRYRLEDALREQEHRRRMQEASDQSLRELLSSIRRGSLDRERARARRDMEYERDRMRSEMEALRAEQQDLEHQMRNMKLCREMGWSC